MKTKPKNVLVEIEWYEGHYVIITEDARLFVSGSPALGRDWNELTDKLANMLAEEIVSLKRLLVLPCPE